MYNAFIEGVDIQRYDLQAYNKFMSTYYAIYNINPILSNEWKETYETYKFRIQ